MFDHILVLVKNREKVSLNPILHYAFSSWIENKMTKIIHCHWENSFFTIV